MTGVSTKALRFWEQGRKIVAIGRNFADHAKELKNPVPKSPFFFLKPTSSYVTENSQLPKIEVPSGCDVHHEVELGVVIGKTGRDIQPGHADDYIAGYCLALDMTARNVQQAAKEKGLPWSAAKGYDTFTPISPFIAKEDIPDAQNVDLWLRVDTEMKQAGNTEDMIFTIPQLLQHVSSIMTLEEGDLLLTGTPAGVGPVLPGQTVTAGLKTATGEVVIKFPVVQRS